MKQKSLFLLFSVFLVLCPLMADVIKVKTDFDTIQEAIDAAGDGDIVIVSPGVYVENIKLSGKNIALKSTDPLNPSIVSATIIDGGALDSAVTFSGTEATSCVLSGFTITNGMAETGCGVNGKGCHATVENNIISTNTIPLDFYLGNGGGLYKCHGIIRDNLIQNNTANAGGGLFECNGSIYKNRIENNLALIYGGGLFSCNGDIENNIIKDNRVEDGDWGEGGGLHSCDGFINKNRIAQNYAVYGGGLYQCNQIVQNNEIVGNRALKNGGALSECCGVIRNNLISGNFAGDPEEEYSLGNGGGLYSCAGLVFCNLIWNNRAGFGGGIYGYLEIPLPTRKKIKQNPLENQINPNFQDGTFQNNTITSNTALYGGGAAFLDGMIINNILWGNIALEQDSEIHESAIPRYCCIQGWLPDDYGNISQNPMFMNPGQGDFHLEPGSSCIDKGVTWYLGGGPLTDIDDECRFEGEGVDIGFDEYNSYPDSDGDLLCDLDEMALESDPNLMDTDSDGLMDGAEAIRGTNPVVYESPAGLSIPDDYPLIQQAVFLGFPLEEIMVAPGTYYENLHLLGKNITLQSIDDSNPEITSSTIVNGAGLNAVITLQGTEDETCLIKGLTLTNGSRGGVVGNGASPTIIHNRIIYNSPRGVMECHGLIESNRISSNTLESSYETGAGLLLCDGIIQNNIISFNRAKGWASQGGGLSLCFGTIRNNIITYNTSQRGGGGFYQCNGIIKNNTIVENEAEDPISHGGGISESYGEIKNCIIWGNKAASHEQIWASSKPSYSCIQDWNQPGTSGNILDDPLFMEGGENFELQEGSPCIDAGDPDILEEDGCLPPGRGGKRNEIGAYGGPQNCGWNGMVSQRNLIDHIIGREILNPAKFSAADLNGDGIVDVADLILFLMQSAP
jgi:hypothetical protein